MVFTSKRTTDHSNQRLLSSIGILTPITPPRTKAYRYVRTRLSAHGGTVSRPRCC